MAKIHLNYHASNSIYELFLALPQESAKKIAAKIQKLCKQRSFIYQDKDGKDRIIPLMMRPRLITTSERDHVWKICTTLNEAHARIPELFLRDPEVRELLPFEEKERDWVHSTLEKTAGQPNPVFSRWDANNDFGRPIDDFYFFENNGVGIGGVWYCPVAEEILLEAVIPELRRLDPSLHLAKNHDARILLMKFLIRHAKAIGRRSPTVALTIDKSSFENFIEFPMLAKFFSRRGLKTVVADPRQFKLSGGEIYSGGKKIDLIYRDTTVSEFIDMESKGANLRALLHGFQHNQVISSMGGEFDHKSLFELFTSGRFAKYFTAKERTLFRRHMLWTRLLREIKTENEKAKAVDLLPYIRKAKNRLVIKPNRLFGGEGVLIGKHASSKAWNQAIQEGLADPGYMVVQTYGTVYQKRFPEFGKTHRSSGDQYYVVIGFIATRDGIGLLGRVSKKKVVNVAQQGGISAVLVRPSH